MYKDHNCWNTAASIHVFLKFLVAGDLQFCSSAMLLNFTSSTARDGVAHIMGITVHHTVHRLKELKMM